MFKLLHCTVGMCQTLDKQNHSEPLGHFHLEHFLHREFFQKAKENINCADETRVAHIPFPVKPLAVTLSFHSDVPKTSVLASEQQFCALKDLILPTVSGKEKKQGIFASISSLVLYASTYTEKIKYYLFTWGSRAREKKVFLTPFSTFNYEESPLTGDFHFSFSFFHILWVRDGGPEGNQKTQEHTIIGKYRMPTKAGGMKVEFLDLLRGI